MVEAIVACAERSWRTPGGATIGRSTEKDLAGDKSSHLVVVKRSESHINVSHGNGLRDRATSWQRDLKTTSAAKARDINGHPRLIQKSRCTSFGHHGCAEETNRVRVAIYCSRRGGSIFLIVEVNEPAKKYHAVVGSAIESDSAITEKAAGPGSNHWIRGCIPRLQWVGRIWRQWISLRGQIQAISGKKRALPGRTAVEGLEQSEPRVPGFSGREEIKIHTSIIISTGQKVADVPRRNGNRRFVLSLQERVAVGDLRARYHVDVLPRRRSLRVDHERNDHREQERQVQAYG